MNTIKELIKKQIIETIGDEVNKNIRLRCTEANPRSWTLRGNVMLSNNQKGVFKYTGNVTEDEEEFYGTAVIVPLRKTRKLIVFRTRFKTWRLYEYQDNSLAEINSHEEFYTYEPLSGMARLLDRPIWRISLESAKEFEATKNLASRQDFQGLEKLSAVNCTFGKFNVNYYGNDVMDLARLKERRASKCLASNY